jgi:hypothetical protein
MADGSMDKTLRRLLQDLDEVFTAPVVFHPGGWGRSVPQGLLRRVEQERLALAVTGAWDRATDAEALCYLMTLSLAAPLGHDVYDIYFYLATRWLPEIRRQVAVPAALSQDQADLLESLQRRIRASQRRNKNQEANMTTPVVKIIVNLEEGKDETQVAIGRDGCDPVILPPVALGEARLPELLAQVPGMLTQAREYWAQSPHYPQNPRSQRSRGRNQPAAELPLLAAREREPVQTDSTSAEPEPAEFPSPSSGQTLQDRPDPAAPDDPFAGLDDGVGGEPAAPQPGEEQPPEEPPEEDATASEEAEPEPETPMVSGPTLALEMAGVQERMEEMEQEQTQADLFAGLDDPPPRAGPEPAPPRSASGGWEYYLADGRGPFDSTLDALDALGVPQEGRGSYWSRHDRLPKKYQDQIQRRAKE